MSLTIAKLTSTDEALGNGAQQLRPTNGLSRLLATQWFGKEVSHVHQREITIGAHRAIDFAHCGYLGVDHDITAADIEQARNWGLRNGWSRITGTTHLTRHLELQLSKSLRLSETRLAQSISLINYTIFYTLSEVFSHCYIERDVHLTMRKGINAAFEKDRHVSWKLADLESLKDKLAARDQKQRVLICIDGVYSMSGAAAPIQTLLEICRDYNAVLFIDDAHGFGVLGRNGLGVLDDSNADYAESVIYVGSFSKCTSNPVAFMSFPSSLAKLIDSTAQCLIFSGPPSNFHVAAATRHLELFPTESYRSKRNRIFESSASLHMHCINNGLIPRSPSGSPIVSVRFNPDHLESAIDALWERGILAKSAIYPVVRQGDEVIRLTISAAHTDQQIKSLKEALLELRTLGTKHG